MGTHLYRSREDRMLAGVAGGLADLWDADPSLIRILWALLVILTGGIALVVYIVMAIVVPEEPDAPLAAGFAGYDAPPAPGPETPAGAPTAAGTPTTSAPAGSFASAAPADWRSQRAAYRDQRRAARRARRAERGYDGRSASIVLGSILLLIGIAFLVREYLPSIDFDYIWPLVLVALGVLVLLAALRPNGGNGSGPGTPS
jgi:phage shock protein C